jgi:hypothetical protein
LVDFLGKFEIAFGGAPADACQDGCQQQAKAADWIFSWIHA